MKHIICVHVTEAQPDPDVPFDPSRWEFRDLADAYQMGLITATVTAHEVEMTDAERRAGEQRAAAHAVAKTISGVWQCPDYPAAGHYRFTGRRPDEDFHCPCGQEMIPVEAA